MIVLLLFFFFEAWKLQSPFIVIALKGATSKFSKIIILCSTEECNLYSLEQQFEKNYDFPFNKSAYVYVSQQKRWVSIYLKLTPYILF